MLEQTFNRPKFVYLHYYAMINRNSDSNLINRTEELAKIIKALGLFAGLGLFLLLLFSTATPGGTAADFFEAFGVFTLLGCASTALGTLFGFLFGFPRTDTKPDPEKEGEPQARNTKNTNLQEIADWLTKILLGAGLTQINAIVTGFIAFTANQAKNLLWLQSQPVIMATIGYFLILGFFLGFCVTAVWLSVLLSQTDKDLADIDRLRAKVDRNSIKLDKKYGSDDDKLNREAKPQKLDSEGQKQTEKMEKEIKYLEAMGETIDPELYRRLARLLRRMDRFQEAVDAYRKAFDSDPENHYTALNSAAVILSKNLGKYDDAERLYKEVLKVAPGYPTATYNLACNAARRGSVDEAIAYLQKAFEIDLKRYAPAAQKDSAFDPIRNDPGFKAFLEKHLQDPHDPKV